MDYREVGIELRRRRLKQGITQAAVAAELGMTDSNVSLIESGKVRTPIENLETYARLVGCEIQLEVVDPGDPAATLLSRMRAALPRIRPTNVRAIAALLDVYLEEDAHVPEVREGLE